MGNGDDAYWRRLRNAGDGFVDDWRRLPPDDIPEGLAFDDFYIVGHLASCQICFVTEIALTCANVV